ncbi:hypothetical protein PPERSA_05786 [Pseudocohnilembus persalinus]|uniref:Histidine phosphatase superfamily, clade-1 n=1 Tax=Pseudocohnilembus persalinus TaxID=266149 RepID=A0A0V0QZT9_PSEPJ|nr:hypothetical protein PPERSA_05786 [Pseudocohnilembus persalinus]|eukprot:KRX07723.1 hypothetical protein PPERSA_05786 [Pseudocohnilembus persalinus]
MDQKLKVHIIRHAESEYNKAQFEFGGYQAATQFKYEHIGHKYDPNLMDPAITEKGIEQCKLAREKIKELNVKLVIVSPLKRTLQTCHEIFKNSHHKPIFIAQPQFREHMQSTCDIGGNIEESKKDYDYIDFSLVEQYPYQKIWTLYEILQHQQIIYEQKRMSLHKQKIEQIENVIQIIKEKGGNNQEYLQQNSHMLLLDYLKEVHPNFIDTDTETQYRSVIQRQIVKQLAKKHNIKENEDIVIVGHRGNLYQFSNEQNEINYNNNQNMYHNPNNISGVLLDNCDVQAVYI